MCNTEKNKKKMNDSVVYDIKLGISVGPFVFGSPISECIHALKSRGKFKILYDDVKPFDRDIFIQIPSDHMTLRFDPNLQTLKSVDINVSCMQQINESSKNITYTLEDQVFISTSSVTTFLSTYKLLGPTHPGSYDEKTHHAYVLDYPVVKAMFPIPPSYQHLYNAVSSDLPLTLPDNSTPALDRIIFTCSTSTTSDIVEINTTSGTIVIGDKNRKFKIGDTIQSVISEIGPPVEIYSKSHVTYHNYTHMGFDLQYIGNTVVKIICHTNALGHLEFNSYVKCNFIVTDDERELVLTPSSEYRDFKSYCNTRPVIHDTGSSPFGSTTVYNIDSKKMSIEVMKNGYIATLAVI